MAKIVHSRDGTFLREHPLKIGKITIGRRPDCDIVLDDTTVSGNHAVIEVSKNNYMDGLLDIHIEDRGSTNGTQVNGRNIKRHLLKHGEVIRIGLHDLTLVDEQTRGFEQTEVMLPEQTQGMAGQAKKTSEKKTSKK